MNNLLYEVFHKNTKLQKDTIKNNNFTYRNILDITNKYISTHPSKENSILDIGCGAGTLAFYYAKKGYRVSGIDISKSAIDACIMTAKYLNLTKRTKFTINEFPNEKINGRFDYIIFSEVIEHLQNDKLALARIYSSLKKDGYLFLTTPSKYAPLYRLHLLDGFDKRVGHLRRYSENELIAKVEKAGFTVVEMKKNEGIVRNFLFTNNIAGNFVRIINRFGLSNIVTFIDNISLIMFGESNYILILKK